MNGSLKESMMTSALVLDALRSNPSPIRNIFYDSMLAGWIGQAAISTADNTSPITFRKGSWEVTDTFHTTPVSDYSHGNVIICHDGDPVWGMQYFGPYPAIAIPTLKFALWIGCRKREFLGGRGPAYIEHKGYYYKNEVQPCSGFHSFQSREHIGDLKTGKQIGWHMCQGGLMI